MVRRTLATTALACLLVAGACGDRGGVPPGFEGIRVTTTSEPGAAPVGTETPPVAPTRPGTGEAGRTTTSPPPAGREVPAGDGVPGTYAGVILQPTPGPFLTLEVLYQVGAEPSQEVVTRMRTVLEQAARKKVTVAERQIPDGSRVWSAADLRQVAQAQSRHEAGESTAVVRTLFVEGAYEDEAALGVALRGDLIAVFPDRVDAAGGLLTGPQPLLRAVVTHELGHLLGLVDLFRDTNRDDPEHPGHSTNRASVMYWAIESGLVTEIFTGPPPENFDDADRADLEAIRTSA